MKDTDKVTLTVGQLKKLVKESKEWDYPEYDDDDDETHSYDIDAYNNSSERFSIINNAQKVFKNDLLKMNNKFDEYAKRLQNISGKKGLTYDANLYKYNFEGAIEKAIEAIEKFTEIAEEGLKRPEY